MSKIIVKVTHPWPVTNADNKDSILQQTPQGSGIWGNYQFEVNNDCAVCDYWIIAENILNTEHVKVPKGNVMLITTEEVNVKTYETDYLKQFDRIITSRRDLQGTNIIRTHYLNWWFIKKGYDELSQHQYTEKAKELSLISSNLTKIQGHKDRLAFVHKITEHFKDKLDVYGRGHNYVDDKFDAIAPYKYSIAIENSAIENYFTEKLIDCYLCNTMPIYFGCPNITDFFNPKSLIVIDIYNYQSAIHTIEKAIQEDRYATSQDYIKEAKQLALQKYQFFPVISNILDSLKTSPQHTHSHYAKIYPQQKYAPVSSTISGYKALLKKGFKLLKQR
ncbi:MAG: glycosyltransferase family 10 [Bacteroidota bacterium]